MAGKPPRLTQLLEDWMVLTDDPVLAGFRGRGDGTGDQVAMATTRAEIGGN